jgi:hypothetical protein
MVLKVSPFLSSARFRVRASGPYVFNLAFYRVAPGAPLPIGPAVHFKDAKGTKSMSAVVT